MDWFILGGALMAGWAMLSVLSGERMNRSQQLAIALASAAAEKTRAASDIPIAVANDAALAGSHAAFDRKR